MKMVYGCAGIFELAVTTWLTATWHIADWVLWRQDEDVSSVPLGSLLLHDALVMRPQVRTSVHGQPTRVTCVIGVTG